MARARNHKQKRPSGGKKRDGGADCAVEFVDAVVYSGCITAAYTPLIGSAARQIKRHHFPLCVYDWFTVTKGIGVGLHVK